MVATTFAPHWATSMTMETLISSLATGTAKPASFATLALRGAPAYSQEGGNKPFGIPDVGDYAQLDIVDIDGDNDLDLFIGKNTGNTLFFRNTGSASTLPTAEKVEILPSG